MEPVAAAARITADPTEPKVEAPPRVQGEHPLRAIMPTFMAEMEALLIL